LIHSKLPGIKGFFSKNSEFPSQTKTGSL